MRIRYGLCVIATAALTACGGGGGGGGGMAVGSIAPPQQPQPPQPPQPPQLSSLQVLTSAQVGEQLSPAFDPKVHEYTLRVQSDTYGVLLQPQTDAEGAQTSVSAAITAGAYSTSVANTDVNAPEAVPLAQTLGNTGYMVKLSQSYAAFDVEYVQTATIDIKSAKTGLASKYVVKIVRDNDSAIRAKFGAEKVFTSKAGTSIKYHIYYPPNYASSTKNYPVVLALHGVGQRAAGGQPSDMVLKRTKQATIWAQDSEANPEKEAIVIAPQANTSWAVSNDPSGTLSNDGMAAYELLQSVLSTERVDASRVYLTGLSMGGNGSLVMAESYPQTFAAVFVNAPFAQSGYDWAAVKTHLDGRIRVVAAEDDPDVKHASYLELVSYLNSYNIDFQNKLYPSGTFFSPTAHFVWIAGYADASARDWVFSLKR